MNKRKLLYYIRNYRFQSLFIRNLLLILALTFVPFAGVGLVVYKEMNHIVQEEISSVNLNSLNRMSDIADRIIKQTDLMATKLSLQSEVQLFVFSRQPEDMLNLYYKELYSSVSFFNGVYNYIDSIYIFSERNQYIISNYAGMPFASFEDQTWYPAFKKREDNNPWTLPRKKEGRYPYLITLVRPLYIYDKEQNGAVIINIDVEELGKAIGRQRAMTDEHFYMINRDGTVLYSEQRDDFMLHHNEVQTLGDLPLVEGSTLVQVQEQDYIMSVIPSDVFDWTYVSLLPVHHYQEKIQSLRAFMLPFSLIGFIVMILVSFIISIRTFAPVKQIMSVIDDPKQGLSPKYGSPELKFILSQITKSIHSKRELESELERRLALLNKSRSVALQSQINPHFLFNTLDTIKWTALRLTKGNNDVSSMISSLSELLRLSMDVDNHLIPLSNEMEHAKKYIEILQYRYKDKVVVHWEIPEMLQDCHIVQISLQPLIENAVYHGIKPLRQNGNIWISGKSVGNDLIIEVKDDGKGIGLEKVQQLNQDFQKEHDLSGKHIGMQNVNQRIKLIFGDNYGLTVRSDGIQGTVVSIWLPRVGHEDMEQLLNRRDKS